jgi:hypothetical protein
LVFVLACVATVVLVACAEDIPATAATSTAPAANVSAPSPEAVKPDEPGSPPRADVARGGVVEPIHIVLDGARKPGDCVEEGKAVQKELQTLPFPPGWKIAIMCTPVRWQAITSPLDQPAGTPEAFTVASQRLTVLDGAIFHQFPPHYRHVMAHELAHIQCKCSDEIRAEKLAHNLEQAPAASQDEKTSGTVQAAK